MAVHIEIAEESTPKRTFVWATDWPGWSRSGKDAILARDAFLEAAARYADVAALVTACMLHPAERGGVVEVFGPAYASTQVAEQLGRALDRSLDVVTIPPPGQLDFLRRVGMPQPFAQALVERFDHGIDDVA